MKYSEILESIHKKRSKAQKSKKTPVPEFSDASLQKVKDIYKQNKP